MTPEVGTPHGLLPGALRALAVVIAGWLVAGCSAGSVGSAIRPTDPKARDALGEGVCSTEKSGGEPLVVDLQAHERADLEEAMSGGLAVVSWSCTSLKLLRDCRAKGSYAFHGLSPQEFTVKLDDADEVKANLPTFGVSLVAKLESEMSRGATLDLAVSMIGKRRTTVTGLATDDLEGSCGGATHFVRGAYLGAFAMATGTRGDARAAVEIFKIGASGSSTSAKLAEARDGDIDACRAFDPTGTTPPARCASLVRLELSPIAGLAVTRSGKEPEVVGARDACPEGLVLVDRKCARPGERPFLCRGDRPVECSEQCDRGHARSCAVLGSLYARAEGVPHDPVQAVTYLGKACNQGDSLGCVDLGVLAERGEGAAKDLVRAASLYGKACEAGEGSGCYDLGLVHELGRGTAIDLARAASLYAKACDAGEASACSNLGLLTEQGKGGLHADAAEARSFYERACQGGFGPGCYNLAVLSKRAEGTSPERVLELFEDACKAGTLDGCFNAGTCYDTGLGAKKDPSKAASLFKKACDGGVGSACLNLAVSLEEGRDESGALAAYKLGCDLKSDKACVGLGAMLEEGKAGAKDPSKAAELYGGACDHSCAEGCVNLGALLEGGVGVTSDLGRSVTLYAKACDLGSASGCAAAGEFAEQGKGGQRKDLAAALRLYRKGCEGHADDACTALNRLGAKR